MKGLLLAYSKTTETQPRRPIGFIWDKPAIAKPVEEALYLDEGHLITIGGTGSGKTVSAVIPTLLQYPGTVVVTDVKGGEIYHVTHRRRREMNQKVVVIDLTSFLNLPSADCYTFNPFDIFTLIKDEDSHSIGRELTSFLMDGQELNDADPFWDVQSMTLISNIIAALLELGDKAQQNLMRVKSLVTSTYELAKVMDILEKQGKMTHFAELEMFLQHDEKLRSSIQAVSCAYLNCIAGKAVEHCLRNTNFDLDKFIRGEPMTIYIVLPVHKLGAYNRILRLYLGALLALLVRRKTQPRHKTLFLVDEAGALGYMKPFQAMMSYGRSFGIQLHLVFQSVAQIIAAYPDDWKNILDNASVEEYMGFRSQEYAKTVCQRTGFKGKKRLMSLAKEEMLVNYKGQAQIVRKINYLTDSLFDGLYDPNPFYENQTER